MSVRAIAAWLPRLRLSADTLTRAMVRWLAPKRLRRYPAILMLGVLAYFGAKGVLALARDYPLARLFGGDFAARYTGARFWLDGRVPELYDLAAQKAFQDQWLTPPANDQLSAFVYLPGVLPFVAAFAWLDYGPALVAWWAAGLAALAAAIVTLKQAFFAGGGPSARQLFFAGCLFFPTFANFLFGQAAAFSLLFFTVFLVCLRRGQDWLAGLALGLVLDKPHLAAGVILVMVIQRRWKVLAGTTLTGLGWMLATLIVGPASLAEYIRLAPRLLTLQRDIGWGEFSLMFFGFLLLDGIWKAGAAALAGLLAVGGAVMLARWWWKRPWQPGTREWDLTMAASLTLGWLLSPHWFVYDLMLLLLPLAIVWSHYPHGTQGRALDGGLLLAWTALLYVFSFGGANLTLAQLTLTEALGLPAMAIQTGGLVLLGWALAVQAKSTSSPTLILSRNSGAVSRT